VGAGLAGVCCALTGHGAARTPTIIAANNIVGGRRKTEFMTILLHGRHQSRETRHFAYPSQRYINTTRY
jgi:hypothetical protein